jgi:hypothetical protein
MKAARAALAAVAMGVAGRVLARPRLHPRARVRAARRALVICARDMGELDQRRLGSTILDAAPARPQA